MRRDIPRRLERLELRAGISADPPPNIKLIFAEPWNRAWDRAGQVGGGLEWNRLPDKSFEAFEQRVDAEATERLGPGWCLWASRDR